MARKGSGAGQFPALTLALCFLLALDCWQVERSPNGTINVDPVRFPGGMKALIDYVHSKGLKFGICTSSS